VASGLVVLVFIASWRQHPPGQGRAQLVTAVVAGCILVVGDLPPERWTPLISS